MFTMTMADHLMLLDTKKHPGPTMSMNSVQLQHSISRIGRAESVEQIEVERWAESESLKIRLTKMGCAQ
jgi:hypothetical protein